MKCDNLQRYSVDIDYVPNDDGAYMDADEVCEAIAELKTDVNNLLMKNRELCQALQAMYSAEEYMELQAEKDKEIALLKERICNGDVSRLTWIDDCIAKDKVIAENDKELRHQKYKRCLAMAILSLEKRESYKIEYEEWCLKWYKRWLELAEKFKEANK